MFLQQKTQLKAFIRDRNQRNTRAIYENPDLMELQSMQTPGRQTKKSMRFDKDALKQI